MINKLISSFLVLTSLAEATDIGRDFFFDKDTVRTSLLVAPTEIQGTPYHSFDDLEEVFIAGPEISKESTFAEKPSLPLYEEIRRSIESFEEITEVNRIPSSNIIEVDDSFIPLFPKVTEMNNLELETVRLNKRLKDISPLNANLQREEEDYEIVSHETFSALFQNPNHFNLDLSAKDERNPILSSLETFKSKTLGQSSIWTVSLNHLAKSTVVGAGYVGCNVITKFSKVLIPSPYAEILSVGTMTQGVRLFNYLVFVAREKLT